MADLEQQWQNPGWQGFSAVKLVLLPLNAAEPNVGKGQITARHPGSYYYARREQFFFFLIKKCPEGLLEITLVKRAELWNAVAKNSRAHSRSICTIRTRTALFSFSSLFFDQSIQQWMERGRTTGIIKLSWIQTLYLQPMRKVSWEERSKVKQNGVKGGEGWMTEDESEELWWWQTV